MMSFSLRSASVAAVKLLLATGASARLFHNGGVQLGPIDEDTLLDGTSGYNGWGIFDQLIDHSNPSLGTFPQRYWYGTQFWGGPGSPIVLNNPGEQSATNFNKSYTTTQRLTGLIAKELGAAVVILEHRYWGESSPYDKLTVENLQYLTLENSIKDVTYFAKNFDTPFDNSSKSSPSDVPWIFSGGSYPGALAGWIESVDPGTFWAYHGTSGVVEAIGDFWQYFVPVQEATPANCSKDLNTVINYIDTVLQSGSDAQKAKLKAKFKLEDLEDADFAGAIENGPWTWQGNQFYSESVSGYNSYYRFCDYIENVWPNSTNAVPGAEGVGQCKALDGYAKWFTEDFLPGTCASYGYADWNGTYNTGCFAYLNSSNIMYKDLTVSNPINRQWMWFLCNEPFEYWQDGAPKDQTTLVSRLVTQEYQRKTCGYFFPEGGYGIAKGKTTADVNAYTGGWSVTNTTRLLYVNGQFDPWRDSTVSSKFRPGGPLQSTEQLPVFVIPGGFHCSDYYSQNWAVNPELQSIVDQEVAVLKKWVGEFYEEKNKTKSL